MNKNDKTLDPTHQADDQAPDLAIEGETDGQLTPDDLKIVHGGRALGAYRVTLNRDSGGGGSKPSCFTSSGSPSPEPVQTGNCLTRRGCNW